MLKRFFENSFIKVVSHNSVIVFGRIITSFVVSKVSAIYLGPSGYAIVGNLRNLLQGLFGVTATGFGSGVVKYVAESKTDKNQFRVVVASAITLSFSLSLILGVLLFTFSGYVGEKVLLDRDWAFIIKYLAFLLPLVSLSFLVTYIVNGLQNFKLYTKLITIANILNALVTFLFIYLFNLKGALLATFVVPALSFFSSLIFKDVRDFLGNIFDYLKNVSSHFIKSIGTYVAMATYSAILISLTYLFIRNKIVVHSDIKTAGLWEAMNKISSFYMLFFSSLFTLYLLPRLAENKTIAGYYTIMKSYFKYIIPLTVIMFSTLFFLKEFIIRLFLTSDFASIEQFFYLQLIGDFLKIIAFSIAYQFHAKKMVMLYIVSDTVLYITFYLASVFLINIYAIQGVFYAYIISVFLYLTVVLISIYSSNHKYLKVNV
ncbi:polysaccharide transporter, PST family [Hyunsoonleella jejuensis]|uniref:Polysaccharide transporter, PST family n=1 Tax=Hyunsoonleella jejuensis TaxID=419940 RepID=A0A1H9J9F9_9FLAO|nr:O-antigen translocase [Hyunsoonleella jejuensis]SEQ83456.1 polysaccharide transporter, PST family [Hyunsoonleella jejuensis]